MSTQEQRSSTELTGLAWRAPVTNSVDLLVLLALAEMVGGGALHNGGQRLAERCRLSEQRLRDSLGRLEHLGLIRRTRISGMAGFRHTIEVTL